MSLLKLVRHLLTLMLLQVFRGVQMSKNLITDHYHSKTTDLFHAVTKLKNADIAIHSINFDAKRIHIEKPSPDQVIRLGVKVIIAATSGRSEAKLNNFHIDWAATKRIVEVTVPRGVTV